MYLISELFKLCFSSRSLERCTISSLATLLSDSRKIVFSLCQTNISFCLFSSKISKKKKGKRKHFPISESLLMNSLGYKNQSYRNSINISPLSLQTSCKLCPYSAFSQCTLETISPLVKFQPPTCTLGSLLSGLLKTVSVFGLI